VAHESKISRYLPIICIAIFLIGLGSGWFINDYLTSNQPNETNNQIEPRYVDIKLSMHKDVITQGDNIEFAVNITNMGNLSIPSEGYCYNVIIVFPNGTRMECFLVANASTGTILPGHSFENEYDSLSAFSNDFENYKHVDPTSFVPGPYRMFLVYKSRTPLPPGWFDMSTLPYSETPSNEVQFEII